MKEKASLELEIKNLRDDYAREKARADRLELQLADAVREHSMSLKQFEEYKSKISITEMQMKDIEKTNRDLKANMGSFQKTIDDLRTRLDVEVRKKGEWESHYIAMKSKLETTIKNHSLELSEYKSMFAQKFDVEYVTREFTEEILAKIHQMRADFDARLAAHRLGVQKIDINIESAQLNRMLSEALMARDSISKHHSQVKEMELKIQSYEAEISRLHARIHDLEELTQHSHIDVDAIIRETYQQVREEIARTNKRVEECDYLLGMNVKLVTELQTYQALLDVEEARLQIGYVTETPVVHHSVHRDTATKGHSDVDLVIDEVNMEGHYVHLTNKGNDDFSLNGWSIKVVCGSDSKTFTFSSTHHIKLASR